MKRSAPAPAGGFTLIEIMMAMAIFGLVLTAIYASWTLILKASKSGLAAAAQVQRERIAIRTIEEALGSTRSYAADLQHYGFIAENGEEATLSFVARLSKSFPRGGKFGDFDVRRVTFSVENGQNAERELVLRQNPILMDVDADELEHPLVLAKGVEELLLEFWDTRLNDWTDAWTQTNQLPKLVKVTLRFTPPNQRNSYSKTGEEVTRIVALPSIMVPTTWQVTTAQGGQGGPGGPGGISGPGGGARGGPGGPGGQGGQGGPGGSRPGSQGGQGSQGGRGGPGGSGGFRPQGR